jgi:hypothetical protein
MKAPMLSLFEGLEHLAYQGIMQHAGGHQLKYRDLVRGPDATAWLDYSSQEWYRLIEGTATLRFVPATSEFKNI